MQFTIKDILIIVSMIFQMYRSYANDLQISKLATDLLTLQKTTSVKLLGCKMLLI